MTSSLARSLHSLAIARSLCRIYSRAGAGRVVESSPARVEEVAMESSPTRVEEVPSGWSGLIVLARVGGVESSPTRVDEVANGSPRLMVQARV